MGKIVTDKVRLSYVALTSPRIDLSGKAKYSVTALLPKSDTATKAKIDKAIAEAIEEGRKGKWNGLVPPSVPTPVHDGDGVRQDGSPFGQECKGHWVFTASTNADATKSKPQVVDTNLNEILNPSEIYSGMYARVSITFAPYFSAGKKGVGCYLNHVQKLGDGEPLAGTKSSAVEDFAGVGVQPTTHQAPQAIDPITGMPVLEGGVMGI